MQRLQLRRNYTTSIQRNGCAVDPRACSTAEPNASSRDVFWASNSTKRNASLDDILEFLQCCFHHLTLEGTTSDGVARDAPLAQVTCQYPAHVV
jgi:hypothetical protein